MKTKYFISILFIILFMSCVNENINQDEEKKLLMKIDSEFSDYSEKNGFHKAFLEYCTHDAVLLRPNNLPFEGKEAIAKLFSEKSDSSIKLVWKPLKAIVSKTGDLGYTYGTYQLFLKDSNILSNEGTYLTVWQKDENGKWKFCADTGNEGLENKK